MSVRSLLASRVPHFSGFFCKVTLMPRAWGAHFMQILRNDLPSSCNFFHIHVYFARLFYAQPCFFRDF